MVVPSVTFIATVFNPVFKVKAADVVALLTVVYPLPFTSTCMVAVASIVSGLTVILVVSLLTLVV